MQSKTTTTYNNNKHFPVYCYCFIIANIVKGVGEKAGCLLLTVSAINDPIGLFDRRFIDKNGIFCVTRLKHVMLLMLVSWDRKRREAA